MQESAAVLHGFSTAIWTGALRRRVNLCAGGAGFVTSRAENPFCWASCLAGVGGRFGIWMKV